MFLKNVWYCAGWDYELTQAKSSVLARKMAGEYLALYRKPDGGVVAFEDRCPHRQAALSLGRKEGDSLRCMYHGLKFGPDGACTEIPGQDVIPKGARVRTYPVLEKDNWIWVWMGDPARADPALVPFAVGYDDLNYNIRTSQMTIQADYRLEIANLVDLSHISWVHENTVGGSRKYSEVEPRHTLHDLGIDTHFVARAVPASRAFAHLFPPDALFDIRFEYRLTFPCTWVLSFKLFTVGTAKEGEPNGTLLLDTWSSQAVTPRDEDSVEYYYSWGASRETDFPGASQMLCDTTDVAFLEDKLVLEAQHQRMKQRPGAPMIGIRNDAGAGKALKLLDQLLAKEAEQFGHESRGPS